MPSRAPADRSTADTDPRLRAGSATLRRLNLAMLAVGIAAFGMVYSTQPLMPALSDEYGVSPSLASLTVSAATGGLALAVVPVTGLVGRYGRVRLMRVGLVVAAVLLVLSAIAPTFWALVTLRGLMGVALAGVVAVAMGHVGAEVHPRAVAGAMGLYVAGNSLGGVSGRLVTSTVADLGGSWRVAELALAAVVVTATAAFWLLLPPSVSDGTSASREGLSTLRQHLRNRDLLVLLVVPFTLMGGFVGVYNYLAYRLVAPPFSLPTALVGLAFLAYLAGTGSSAVAGRLADRFGRRPTILAAGGVLLVGLALTLVESIVAVLVGLVVFTAGFFAAHAVASGWVPALVDGATSQASGLYVMSYYAGSSFFGAVLGLAYADVGWGGLVVAVAVLTAVAGLAICLVRGHDTRTGVAD